MQLRHLLVALFVTASALGAATRASAQAVQLAPLFDDRPQTPVNFAALPTLNLSRATDERLFPPVPAPKQDAQPAQAPPAAVPDPQPALTYAIELPAGADVVVTVATTQERDAISMALYSSEGRALQAAVGAATEQRLVIKRPPDAFRGLLQVRLETPRVDAAVTARVSLTTVGSVARSPQHPFAGGYADRRVMSQDDYEGLVRFGLCDAYVPPRRDAASPPIESTPASQCGTAVDEKAYDIVWRLIGAPEVIASEPLALFVGAAGVNRIVLLDGRNRVPSSYRSLGRARDFWVAYVEDGSAPFETSIDVEFKAQRSASQFEELDPAGMVSTGAARQGDSTARVVRVGFRRLHVPPPPTGIDVTFSRQAVGYGLRQWRRSYQVRSWSPIAMSGGVFIPATEVFVDYHNVVPRERLGDLLPIDAVVVHGRRRRPLFIAATIYVPERRERAERATGSPAALWYRLLPEFVVGAGLPTSRNTAWYTGLAWPIAGDRLSLTLGSVLINQDKLAPGYRVGDRVPLRTPVNQLTQRGWVSTLTFGATIDLVWLR